MSETNIKIAIEKVLSGDVNAFNEIINTFRDRIFRFCYNFLGNYDDAMESTQEILLIIFKALKNFRGESKFSTWVYSITANYCRNYKKKLRKMKSVPLYTYGDDEEKEIPLPDEKQDFEKTLLLNETMEVAKEELARLPKEYREILILRDIEGMSYEEISEMLGITLSNVKVRIHRGREMLKRSLAQRGIL